MSPRELGGGPEPPMSSQPGATTRERSVPGCRVLDPLLLRSLRIAPPPNRSLRRHQRLQRAQRRRILVSLGCSVWIDVASAQKLPQPKVDLAGQELLAYAAALVADLRPTMTYRSR